MISVAAVVLAAGRGRRFGAQSDASKLTSTFRGQPLIRHAITGVAASKASPIIVVLGYGASSVEAALSNLLVRLLHNREYRTGLSSSLRLGIAAVPPEAAGAIVVLGDMPLVLPATIDRLIERFGADPNGIDAVQPRLNGRTGNPVLVGRRMFEALMRLEGDEGAGRLLRDDGRRIVFCDVDDEGIAIDVDTPQALAALRQRI